MDAQAFGLTEDCLGAGRLAIILFFTYLGVRTVLVT